MTRDEAIKIEENCQRRYARAIRVGLTDEEFRTVAEINIYSMVALGILKLDEPKSLGEKVLDAWEKLGPEDGVNALAYALDAAGLKIVEK